MPKKEAPKDCGNCGDYCDSDGLCINGCRRIDAQQYLADAAAADTHSSDVEPMVEEWFK